jgi:hypothetical protein
MTASTSEGKKNFADAKAHCVAKGMRMALYTELCYAKQTGALTYPWWYWAPSDNDPDETRAVDAYDFHQSQIRDPSDTYDFKCVK